LQPDSSGELLITENHLPLQNVKANQQPVLAPEGSPGKPAPSNPRATLLRQCIRRWRVLRTGEFSLLGSPEFAKNVKSPA